MLYAFNTNITLNGYIQGPKGTEYGCGHNGVSDPLLEYCGRIRSFRTHLSEI